MYNNKITFIMEKTLIKLIVVLLFLSCKPAQYLKFDNNPPELTPKIFAKDLISKNDEFVGYCAFNHSGSELYYAQTDSNWATSKILKISSNNLTRTDTLYLKDKKYEGEPFLTKDDKAMYFTVMLEPLPGKIWQSDIYKVTRTPNGWSAPVLLDSTINSGASEWHISFTDRDIAYFTSERESGTSALHGDIFRAELKDGKFIHLSKLPAPINTDYNDSDPLIAPDESYLIFHSNRPGGFGEHDLYISFNNKGKWTNPVNMGKEINTAGWEMAPTLTPDGKYLLYTWRKSIVTSETAVIYWVSTKILERYKLK